MLKLQNAIDYIRKIRLFVDLERVDANDLVDGDIVIIIKNKLNKRDLLHNTLLVGIIKLIPINDDYSFCRLTPLNKNIPRIIVLYFYPFLDNIKDQIYYQNMINA
jgi:hypothetical protein